MVNFSSSLVLSSPRTPFSFLLMTVCFSHVSLQLKVKNGTTSSPTFSYSKGLWFVLQGLPGLLAFHLSMGFTGLGWTSVMWPMATVNQDRTSSDAGKPRQVLRACSVRLAQSLFLGHMWGKK